MSEFQQINWVAWGSSRFVLLVGTVASIYLVGCLFGAWH